MSDDLLEIGRAALEHADRLGADQAEVYLASSRSFSLEVENSAIKSALERRDSGVGVRSVIGKRIGFAYVTTLFREDVLEAVSNSISLAKASIPDQQFESLPSYVGVYPSVKGLCDRAIRTFSPDDAADMIVRVVDAGKEVLDGKDFAIEAHLGSSYGSKAVMNSLDVTGHAETTSVVVSSSPSVKANGEQTSSHEFQIARRLSEIDPEWVGTCAAQNTLATLGARKIECGEMPVIFAPKAVDTVLGHGLAEALSAEEVQYGRSYIVDDIGNEITADVFHIVDDGLMPSGIGSRRFDAEGYPSQRTSLIESGMLKSLLHDSYTAHKDGVKNTGNAGRPSYAGIPSVSSSNFVIVPGSGGLDDLIGEVSRGVLCKYTADHPNLTTGDLSAFILEGDYIEHGSVAHPLKNTLIGINMHDLLKRITRVAADSRVMFDAISPSILIGSAKVTSG